MTKLLTLVVAMSLLTWFSLMVATTIRGRTWSLPHLLVALGNRDNASAPSVLAARADRAAENTKENFILFTALALTAAIAGLNTPRIELGAQVFVIARLVYLPLYVVGVPYVRSLAWGVGIAGLGMMVSGLL